MKIARLSIANFRGVKNAVIDFSGHTLLLGANNVGKSTVCEALDLVLGPERINRYPPVEEFDFYNAKYLDTAAEEPTAIPIAIEVIVTDLSEDLANKCASYVRHWHTSEKRMLEEGEADLVDGPSVVECLRLKTLAQYDPGEDEFAARTFFVDSQKADGELVPVQRNVKRMFGFLYLRTLRTGSRALSLERGSLLDLILRQRNIQTGIWEDAISRLRDLDPPIDEGAASLVPILDNIEKRVAQYIPLEADGRITKLYVSQLTREHLRKTISFFLKTGAGEESIPFQEVGTGTLNTLVLALLTFLAEIYKKQVIFAMEEPEIALPPHTQRRISNYLLENTSQCIVTSHSPYVLERFAPEQIQILRKDASGTLAAIGVPGSDVLKGKTYRKHARRGLAEAMLGRGVIVGEGITEKDVLWAVAEQMESARPDLYYPLDLSGVTILTPDGDGSMHEFGAFFRAMQIPAFGLYDTKKSRSEEEARRMEENFDIPRQIAYTGMEKLLVEEIPVSTLWSLLAAIRDGGDKPSLAIPAEQPSDAEVKEKALSLLRSEKGNGYAARLIQLCSYESLPKTITTFLEEIYKLFQQPTAPPPVDLPAEKVRAAAAFPLRETSE
jgi:putative ATP-dependent endonuclease of OLD family